MAVEAEAQAATGAGADPLFTAADDDPGSPVGGLLQEIPAAEGEASISPVSVTGVIGKMGDGLTKGITGVITGLTQGEGETPGGADVGGELESQAQTGGEAQKEGFLTNIGRSVTGDDSYEFGQYTTELFDKGMEAVGKVKAATVKDPAAQENNQVVFTGYGVSEPEVAAAALGGSLAAAAPDRPAE